MAVRPKRVALLGVEPDAVVAARFGLTAIQVIQARYARGIRAVKDCATCGLRFTVDSNSRHCPSCRPHAKVVWLRAAQRRWKANNRHRDRELLLARYGLTESTLAELIERQHSLCPICYKPLGSSKDGRHIDHVHGSNPVVVRGVIHGRCNRALGLLHDDPAAFRRAATYLEAMR